MLVFGADEIKIGFMSSGDKTNLEMKLRKRKPGREWVKDGKYYEKIENMYARTQKNPI